MYQQWVSEYQDQVWSLARYLLKDNAEAEDVTQEAFTRLWRDRSKVAKQPVRPWLLKVTRNLCLDRHRRQRPEVEYSDHIQQGQNSPEPDQPLADYQRAELGRSLAQAVADLGEPYRSLVVLHDIHQHSYEEVAIVTELSLDQVKVYLFRARRKLRQQLTAMQP